jgi:hypothetical protein
VITRSAHFPNRSFREAVAEFLKARGRHCGRARMAAERPALPGLFLGIDFSRSVRSHRPCRDTWLEW